MVTDGIDALLLSVGADLPYLTGYRAMPLERLTMAVVTDARAVLIVPALEAPRVTDGGSPFEVVPWDEGGDPVSLVSRLVPDEASIAIGAQTWARFVLELQEALPGSTWRDATGVTSALRVRKDDGELARLRAVGAAADSVMTSLSDTGFAGRTERQLAAEIDRRLRQAGHETVEFVIVASGPNGASPHHEPGDRVMKSGDLVVCDFGGSMGGYQSDTTRTFSVGEPEDDRVSAYAALQSAQQVAFEAVAVGVTCESIDAAARAHLEAEGWGEFFIHRVGHGIGLDVHEEPYLVKGNDSELEPGMAFSIEPGIYIPGRFGMRLEDIVAVTSDGVERLNNSPRELVVVG
ncbi:MAG: aminopeptidase P family protein [Acidimicrobiia bacterium]|nr:aminopeptidase P family protein [Acidimicrobiia bacterium]